MTTSETIAQFLDFLRGVPLQYRRSLVEQKEQEDLTQDLLHHLELDHPNYREAALIGQKIGEARRRRRAAKDRAEELKPVDDYITCNKAAIHALEKLLGDVRKAEQKHQNRFYVPRAKGGTDRTQ